MNDSQFGGRLPIGAAMMMPACGTLLTMQDGSVWLQSGALASAASYPAAAGVEHLKAHVLGTRGTGGAFTSGVASLVTDGAGKYLASHGGTATHSLSTDGGVTWTTLSTGVSGTGHALAYGNGRWVVVNNDTTKIYFSSSSTALSGSWAAPSSQNITSGTNAVSKVVWSGTQFVASCGQSAGAYIFTSPDGVTWTQRTMTVGTPGNVVPFVSADGNRIVISQGVAIFASVDAGATWADVTPAGFSGAGPVHTVAGRFFVFGSINLTSTDPSAAANWSSVTLPTVGGLPPGGTIGCLSPDRSLLTLLSAGGQAGLWMTADGQAWRNRAVDAAGTVANASIYAFGASDMVLASTIAANAANAPPYRGATSPVGVPNAVGKLPLQGSTSGQLYVRIK